MNINKAITYSLLSHIRSNSTLIKGPLDIFVPLIKRVLSKMNEDGVFSGKSITEIKSYSDKLYSFDFPLPVLENILRLIENELNLDGQTKFTVHQDKSFAIHKYVFTEFEDEIRKHKEDVLNLQKLFSDFCVSSGFEAQKDQSIFDFIESSKLDLSKYLANKDTSSKNNYSIEAQFIEYFRPISQVYDFIKKIYLGSIISGYIEYKTTEATLDVELLLDTNFIIAALDLNTLESAHTCLTLLKIANSQGFKCKVMNITIEEIRNLLQAKADNFNNNFLQRVVYPEDVYNACERRELNKADLERIIDNIADEIANLGIQVIYDTSKYQNLAKFSPEYRTLKEHRNTDKAALHDAAALQYVRDKRGKKVYDFEKVNCWFVNNSISREGESSYSINGQQPEIIKADDLLNILWLSNPQSKIKMSDDELTDIGLSSLVSLALNKELPKTSVIRELDDNIHKYSKTEISDTDILRIATRITSKQLKDVEYINELAESNKEEFVSRLKSEAKKQEQIEINRLKMLEEAVAKLSEKSDSLDIVKVRMERKEQHAEEQVERLKQETATHKKDVDTLKSTLLAEQNKIRGEKRKEFYKTQVKKWRRKSWVEFIFSFVVILAGFIYFFWTSNWNFDLAKANLIEFKNNFWIGILLTIVGFIFTKITLPTLVSKYRNHSNIENFKKGLELPTDCEELKEVQLTAPKSH
jgi:hypothetical protein